MPGEEKTRRRQTVRGRLQQKIASRQRGTLSPQEIAKVCENDLAELLKHLTHFFDFQIEHDSPTREASIRRAEANETVRWAVVLEQLASAFIECETRWPSTPEQHHTGAKKMIRNNPLLDLIADSKERYTLLKFKAAQLPADAVIMNPTRLGIRRAS